MAYVEALQDISEYDLFGIGSENKVIISKGSRGRVTGEDRDFIDMKFFQVDSIYMFDKRDRKIRICR